MFLTPLLLRKEHYDERVGRSIPHPHFLPICLHGRKEKSTFVSDNFEHYGRFIKIPIDKW